MLTTIFVYTYIWRYLSRSGLRFSDGSSNGSQIKRKWYQRKNSTQLQNGDSTENLSTPLSSFNTRTGEDDQGNKTQVIRTETTVASDYILEQKKKTEREIKHMVRILDGLHAPFPIASIDVFTYIIHSFYSADIPSCISFSGSQAL